MTTTCRSRSRLNQRRSSTPGRSGVTLAEVAISTLLVGVLMVGALRTVESSLMTWQTAAGSGEASALASQILNEVLALSYEDTGAAPVFGPETGETTGNRSLFDDVDDYDGWTALPPQDRAGNAIPGFAGWSREVEIRKLDATSHAVLAESAPDQGLRQICVKVTPPSGDEVTFVTWRSLFAGTQQPLGVDQTVITWVGCDLQLDPADDVLTAGTSINNHAEDQ